MRLPRKRIMGWRCCHSMRVARILTVGVVVKLVVGVRLMRLFSEEECRRGSSGDGDGLDGRGRADWAGRGVVYESTGSWYRAWCVVWAGVRCQLKAFSVGGKVGW